MTKCLPCGIIVTVKERKEHKMYIVKRLDTCANTWNYMNTFKTYAEAVDKMEWMKKTYKGQYRIEKKED